jgi:hypothetical protein
MSQAVEVAKSAIADIQQPPEQETGPGSGEKDQEKEPEGDGEEEEEERRKAALDKLEKASEDSILGQAISCLALLLSQYYCCLPGLGNAGDNGW